MLWFYIVFLLLYLQSFVFYTLTTNVFLVCVAKSFGFIMFSTLYQMLKLFWFYCNNSYVEYISAFEKYTSIVLQFN